MERFAFGENWKKYGEYLEENNYLAAKASLKELIPDMEGKTFLDIGCGSGLFCAAASGLGATTVTGFDVDSDSVAASKAILNKVSQWDPSVKKDSITFALDSILADNINYPPHDIVYSWGVLHHTGDMYKAFAAAAGLVKKGGILAIAIYNKYPTSLLWKGVKYTYVKSPAWIKKIMIWLAIVRYAAVALVVTGTIPWSGERGMRFYTDVVDWIGGYPYEYASVGEVTDFFEKRGFKCTKVIAAKGGTGCNQFVFNRKGN